MEPIEWQEMFLASVKQLNIYPPAVINALLERPDDAAEFKQKAYALLAPYESQTVSVSGGAQHDPLSPRAVYLAIAQIGVGSEAEPPAKEELEEPITNKQQEQE